MSSLEDFREVLIKFFILPLVLVSQISQPIISQNDRSWCQSHTHFCPNEYLLTSLAWPRPRSSCPRSPYSISGVTSTWLPKPLICSNPSSSCGYFLFQISQAFSCLSLALSVFFDQGLRAKEISLPFYSPQNQVDIPLNFISADRVSWIIRHCSFYLMIGEKIGKINNSFVALEPQCRRLEMRMQPQGPSSEPLPECIS